MRVRVRYFAVLREQRGKSEDWEELPEGCTATDAYAMLCPPAQLPVGYAINHDYVAGATKLKEGDELVFLPPLGGG
jgi:molybdopterin converting factor small subunit